MCNMYFNVIVLSLFISNFNFCLSNDVREKYYFETDTIDKCTSLLGDFSIAVSNFTSCSVIYSRPIKVCANCIDSYIDILTTYRKLTQTHVNGTACIDNFINLDRLQVVNSIYQNMKDLWNRARCDECFTFVNGTLTHEPSVIKKKFNKLYNNFTECLKVNNASNETTRCNNCLSIYIELNKYYFKTGDIIHGIDGLCMDIVDLMNKTQANWSETCCKYRRKEENVYIGFSIFIGFLPILFYVFTKIFVDIRKTKILQQSRFAESIIDTPSTSFQR